MWCSECRFSGVCGGQRCGVLNADLAVSVVAMGVGLRMQMLQSLNHGQRCGVGKKDLTVDRKVGKVSGGQRCGVVNADLALSVVASDVVESMQI